MRNSWYEFKNSGPQETTLSLNDEIGGFGKSAASFIQDLQAIPQDNRLVLRIFSPGGNVLDGNAIFNALKAHPGGVTTQIDFAASMASVVALAGDTVRIAGNGLMMIHNVNGGINGDAEAMRQMADLVDKIQSTVERVYVAKTGLGIRKIREMMQTETWMTATEAEELGFVDEITGDLALAAKFDLTNFKNVPQDGAHGVIALPGRDGTPLPSAPLTADEPAMDTPVTEQISNPETTVTNPAEIISAHEAVLNDKVKEIEILEADIKTFSNRYEQSIEENKLLSKLNDTLKGEIVALEAEAKTAEARAREISARMQVNLPEKPAQPGEEIPNAISELKGFDKTRAYFASRQPKPANP